MRPTGGSVEDVRAGVIARLRARRGELVREISTRVRAGTLAGAGEDDAEYVAGLRAAVGVAVEYVLAGIERGGGDPGPIPAVALEQARRAARVGVSLDTVLRRYVVGSALLGEFVMEEAERGDLPWERKALRGALRAQASVLDQLLAAITVEYQDELTRASRSLEQRRCEQVRGLLAGGGESERSELEYELEGWHLGAIATGPGAALAVRGLAEGMGCRLLSIPNGEYSVWAWLGGRERFARAAIERALTGIEIDSGSHTEIDQGAGTETDLLLALGEPSQGLGGWRLTHRQAQAALGVALRRPVPGGVTRYADVALLALALGDEMQARSLIEVYLAPLDRQRDGGAISRETLRAYFAAGLNMSSAAAALGVSRNTVESRLRTVEQGLGRPLLGCFAELEVALRLEQLGDAASGERRSSFRS